MARLEADELTVDAGGHIFSPPAMAQVHSDPGSSVYRTLELNWFDGDVEMRLNVYFAANAGSWWVSSVRSYDGRSPGDWIYYVTPRVGAGLGQAFEGDVDVLGFGLGGVGRLRISGLRMSAFAEGTIPRTNDGCRPLGPVSNNPFQPAASEMRPDVPGVSLTPGMRAADAEAMLRQNGICYQFRLSFPAENQGQIWCSAPPGAIRDWLFESRQGVLLLFVEAGPRETLPPDWPQVVGC